MSSATLARSFRCTRVLFTEIAFEAAEVESNAKLLFVEVSLAGMEFRLWDEAEDDYILLCTDGRACLMCAEAGEASEAEAPVDSMFQLCASCAFRLGMEMQGKHMNERGKFYQEITDRYRQGHDYTAEARVQTWLHRATYLD